MYFCVGDGRCALYVCICNAVTERDIRCAVEAGARCVRSVRKVTAASTGCGTCAERVAQVVQDAAVSDTGWAVVGVFEPACAEQ